MSSFPLRTGSTRWYSYYAHGANVKSLDALYANGIPNSLNVIHVQRHLQMSDPLSAKPRPPLHCRLVYPVPGALEDVLHYAQHECEEVRTRAGLAGPDHGRARGAGETTRALDGPFAQPVPPFVLQHAREQQREERDPDHDQREEG